MSKPSPVDAVRQGFARRRERSARIRLRRGTGQPVVLGDDDPRDYEPDPPAWWDEDRALARMEDAYEREIERNYP